jgi:hypothetical protein
MTRPAGTRRATTALCALAFLVSSCAPARIRLPEGPGGPLPGFADTFNLATATCQGVRTLTAEIAVSGRVAGQRLRGRVLAGFERPGSLRLEALAPFGSPFFILAAKDNEGTLLLPRDGRVLTGAAPRDIIEALTGLDRSPADLHALLSGCLVPNPTAIDGQSLQGDWALVVLDGGSRAYLRRLSGVWRVVAGQVAGRTVGRSAPGLTVEYAGFVQGLPSVVNLWQDAEAGGAVSAALAFRLSQIEANRAINPAAFAVAVPSGATPLTLDELRRSGPLAGSTTRDR